MPDEPERMVCMEVWGGCEPIERAVTMAGLDAWVYSKPYCEREGDGAQGGGDVYYVSSCATGRINRLLVADVSGHGAGVRAIAVVLRDLMRRYVNYLDQSRFVTAMNARFVESSDVGVFATAVVTTFFAPTCTLSVCNAGHPQPLVYRKATGRWELLSAVREGREVGTLPLGIVEIEDAAQFEAALDVGDLVLIYTDSLVEARVGGGELLGTDGLLRIANEPGLSAGEPAGVVPALLKAIERESGRPLEQDDVTCLLLRPTGAAVRVTWREQVAATFRVVRGVVGALVRLKRPPLPDRHPANMPGMVVPGLQRRWHGPRT
ncbi:MAG TPA: PP2C family protein-serine/threonine phosphatase [Tepidisphaeraceae bacterium]|nr:PP2C family protein-serine/threonine phosphatase [Tepidisphaeraceae bacterium]